MGGGVFSIFKDFRACSADKKKTKQPKDKESVFVAARLGDNKRSHSVADACGNKNEKAQLGPVQLLVHS
eukprot:4202199-Amphidinium_carterae.1